MKPELGGASAKGTWETDGAASRWKLWGCSAVVLAVPELPLPSERMMELAGAHACLSVLITEGSGTRPYRVLDPEPRNSNSNPGKDESEGSERAAQMFE